MEWSKYQKAIFEDVQEGDGHTIFTAVAGSGKTKTLVESLNYVDPKLSCLMVAFNKNIADELRLKVGGRAEVKTLHALALKSVYKRFPNTRIEQNKVFKLLDNIVGKGKEFIALKYQIQRCVSLCKANLASSHEEIDNLIDFYDLDTLDLERENFTNLVSKTMLKSFEETSIIDFDDMLWFVNMYGLPVHKYDRAFVDEAQDLNPAQIEIVLDSCKPDGRIFACGDVNQAMYTFRGADSRAIDNIAQKLNAKFLPLNICYRCPKSVIKEAQKLVPEIECAPNAIEGKVEYIDYQKMIKGARPGCFILSRSNAPLIGLALSFIRNGTSANILGRDIGANLCGLIKKSKTKKIDSFLTWLNKWKNKELKRLHAKNMNASAILDKVECLEVLAEDCSSVSEMKEKITKLFDDVDDKKMIILSTVHKAKGLERNDVYMLLGTFNTKTQEESNIKYVSITRSKENLYLVTKAKK